MKFLLIIFSAYTLFISTTNCCGDYGMGKINHQTELQDNSHGAYDCTGACSPFCACSVCPGFSGKPFFNPFQLQLPEYNFQEYNYYLTQNYLSPLLKGIWQPPQEL